MVLRPLLILLILIAPAPLSAKQAIGVYKEWAAFRDDDGSRCYAITRAALDEEDVRSDGVLSIGVWPKLGRDPQVHVTLSSPVRDGSLLSLSVGGRRFRLSHRGDHGYARDVAMDRAIIAAIRAARSLSVEGVSTSGRAIVEAFDLKGAASAIDAARLACR